MNRTILNKNKIFSLNKTLQNTKFNLNSSSQEKLKENLVKNKSSSLPSSLSMYNEKIILDYENLII